VSPSCPECGRWIDLYLVCEMSASIGRLEDDGLFGFEGAVTSALVPFEALASVPVTELEPHAARASVHATTSGMSACGD
jgi:hypothetical protein